ncbi:MAG: SulP family inorganic anion transporter [Phycisphaerales bacterium]
MESMSDQRTTGRFPILEGVLPLCWARIPAELLAGVTLAAIAIPEVMGYTKIAGTPVITGLYTMLIPTALFAVFGSSRHLVVGADSATAAILASALVGIAATGSDQYVALAGVLALMAAAFLIIARVLRLGFLSDFLSRTVLIGFLTGVGVQVAIGQIGGMLGLEGGGHGTLQKVWNDVQQLGQVDRFEFAIAVAVLVVIVVLKVVSKKIPGALIAAVGALIASWAFGLDKRVHVVGAVPGGLPHLGLPKLEWNWETVTNLIPSAFAMFVVILAQSAATASAYATRYGERLSANTDLVGLAFANIGAGLSGTFVVNGSPTKTQIVDSAGGRSQLSLLVMSAIVLLILLFLTGPLAYMPEAALSAMVFLIGVGLIDIAGMRRVFEQRRAEFWIALITALTVVFVGVQQGILLAIALSLVEHTRHGYRPKNAVLVAAESGGRVPQPVATAAQLAPGLIVYRFTHSLYYANCQQFADEIAFLVRASNPPLRWLCLDGSAIDDVDYSAAEALRSVYARLKAQGIRLVVAEVMDIKHRTAYRFQALFGEDSFFDELDEVVRQYRREYCPKMDASGVAAP